MPGSSQPTPFFPAAVPCRAPDHPGPVEAKLRAPKRSFADNLPGWTEIFEKVLGHLFNDHRSSQKMVLNGHFWLFWGLSPKFPKNLHFFFGRKKSNPTGFGFSGASQVPSSSRYDPLDPPPLPFSRWLDFLKTPWVLKKFPDCFVLENLLESCTSGLVLANLSLEPARDLPGSRHTG